MITILDSTTKNPLTIMGERAGICYGSSIKDPEQNYRRGIECIKSGHDRVMEYVNVEMIIDGYSARVIREWYTHLGGSPTRLQKSTRYIDYAGKGFDYIIPFSIDENSEAYDIYIQTMDMIMTGCRLLKKDGIPEEDIANILPLGMTTTIVDKRNLRNLVDMSHQRLCNRTYWEYHELFYDIIEALKAYSNEWNWIVTNCFMPKCFYLGRCPESKPCGKYKW